MPENREVPIVDVAADRHDIETFQAGGTVPANYRRAEREGLAALDRAPFGFVLRGTGFETLDGPQRGAYIRRLTGLFGQISDSNRFSETSNVFVDMVAPTEPGSADPTFSLGECEAHSDESSKPRPEDVVLLWCVRPAEKGGESLFWPAAELRRAIGATAGGAALIEELDRDQFLFGGKLRNPPRVLRAPIFFPGDGIRFRLGSLQDAGEVSGRPPTKEQRAAIEALSDAVAGTAPYRYRLEAGEALVLMNRKMLHARTDFVDDRRLLLRTRCFNDELSNSRHDQAAWLS
ncbi:TauD/TfdA family dioxygenase [Micromonospora sp. NPDC048170]|uniref:TauD/TfdA family dioxygenase n=1 Tax=Micromonospora sp. NPDC048170 TaxID=3154819 RepID=UPI0033E745EB